MLVEYSFCFVYIIITSTTFFGNDLILHFFVRHRAKNCKFLGKQYKNSNY